MMFRLQALAVSVGVGRDVEGGKRKQVRTEFK